LAFSSLFLFSFSACVRKHSLPCGKRATQCPPAVFFLFPDADFFWFGGCSFHYVKIAEREKKSREEGERFGPVAGWYRARVVITYGKWRVRRSSSRSMSSCCGELILALYGECAGGSAPAP
jgi:hypothetical protein